MDESGHAFSIVGFCLNTLGGSDQVNYLIWWQNAEETGLIFSL
jgi:hypothetical protein